MGEIDAIIKGQVQSLLLSCPSVSQHGLTWQESWLNAILTWNLSIAKIMGQ